VNNFFTPHVQRKIAAPNVRAFEKKTAFILFPGLSNQLQQQRSTQHAQRVERGVGRGGAPCTALVASLEAILPN
jgi:hypothetical protein